MVSERKYPGRLIAVEGLDGSGKSTQIYLVKRWLELQGSKVFFTQWNSSVLVRKATSKGKKRQLLTPTSFSLIHATDFADRYERQILPLLRAGFLVLADRFTDGVRAVLLKLQRLLGAIISAEQTGLVRFHADGVYAGIRPAPAVM